MNRLQQAAEDLVVSLMRQVLAAFTCPQSDRRSLLKAARAWLLQELLTIGGIPLGELLMETLGLLMRQAQIRFILPFITLSTEPCAKRSKSKKKTVEPDIVSSGGNASLAITKYQIKNLCKVSRGLVISLMREELASTLNGNIPGSALSLLLLAQSTSRSGKWCDVNAPLFTLEILLAISEAINFTLDVGERELLLEGLGCLPFDLMSVWSTAMKIVAKFELAGEIDPAGILPRMMAPIPAAKLYSKAEQAGMLLPTWRRPLLIVLAGGGQEGVKPTCKIKVKTLRKLVVQWDLAHDMEIVKLLDRAQLAHVLVSLRKTAPDTTEEESRSLWRQAMLLAAGEEDLEEDVGRAIVAKQQKQCPSEEEMLSPRQVFQCMQRALEQTQAAHKAQLQMRGLTALTSKWLLDEKVGLKSSMLAVTLEEPIERGEAERGEALEAHVPVMMLQTVMHSPARTSVVPVLFVDTITAALQFAKHVDCMVGSTGCVISIDAEWSNCQPLATVQIACRSSVPSEWGGAALIANSNGQEGSGNSDSARQRECVYIVDMLSKVDVMALALPPMSALLNSPQLTKLGFSPEQDVGRLKASGVQLEEDIGLVDLQALFGERWEATKCTAVCSGSGSSSIASSKKGAAPKTAPQSSLKRVVHATLGQEIDKTEQCSAWDQRPLTCNQVEYAAIDAHCLLQVWDALESL
jgi:hypothetical protein